MCMNVIVSFKSKTFLLNHVNKAFQVMCLEFVMFFPNRVLPAVSFSVCIRSLVSAAEKRGKN